MQETLKIALRKYVPKQKDRKNIHPKFYSKTLIQI